MSAVVLARHDNVVDVDFSGPISPGPEDSSWWPWAEGAEQDAAPGSTPAAIRRLPARWSPRPVSVLLDRFARSQLADDLRHYGRQLWFLGGLLAGLWLATHVIPTDLTGGTP